MTCACWQLQGLLCGVLQVIVQKLSESDAAKAMILLYVDTIMETLLMVFQAQGQQGVHEEAMLAVGALTYASGKGFLKYMPGFFPFLKLGLANHQARSFPRVLAPVAVLGCRSSMPPDCKSCRYSCYATCKGLSVTYIFLDNTSSAVQACVSASVTRCNLMLTSSLAKSTVSGLPKCGCTDLAYCCSRLEQ